MGREELVLYGVPFVAKIHNKPDLVNQGLI